MGNEELQCLFSEGSTRMLQFVIFTFLFLTNRTIGLVQERTDRRFLHKSENHLQYK